MESEDTRSTLSGALVPPPVPRAPVPAVSANAIAVVLVLLASLGGAVGYKSFAHAKAARAAEPSAGPRQLLVTHPSVPTGNVELTLPGTVRALESATLFAKTQGYVRSMPVNIGDRVKKGALLAELDVPELGEQLALARAKKREAEANVGLVQRRSDRAGALARAGLAASQDADDAAAKYNSAVADVSSTQAEARRLESMNHYLRVVAPSDGIITKRYLDPGAVVNSGTTALFDIATSDTLKVVVDVPQSMASSIQPKTTAEVTAKSGTKATVELLRSAGALDEVTRTMRVEFAVPPAARFLPGTYVDVKLSAPRPPNVRVLPSATLYVDASGIRVVTVGADDLAHFVKVTIARDLGREVELATPLDPSTNVALFPPADLVEGERVVPTQKAAPAK